MLIDNQSPPTSLPQAINNDQFLGSLVDSRLQATGVILEWNPGARGIKLKNQNENHVRFKCQYRLIDHQKAIVILFITSILRSLMNLAI